MAMLPVWISNGGSMLLTFQIIAITTFYVNCCFLPEFKSPLHGLRFKTAKGYPRKNISDEINLNKELRLKIRAMGRMRMHQRKILSIFPEEIATENADIPFTLNTCAINRKYSAIKDIIVDEEFGDCWILRQWRGLNITWAECDRYCKEVPAKPPYFVYLCLPGHVIDFQFWAFCPRFRRFIMRTIALPQCCFCTKYTCLIQPRIKVKTYHNH